MRILENLKKLASESQNKRGGDLLNIIYKFMINASDKSIRDLFQFLLEKSTEPFLEILKKWIYNGILEDPF